MKILTIKQPWASLIIHGGKDIENRDWRTHHRGPVLIHASMNPDTTITERDLMRRFGIGLPRYRPNGGIIGIVDIVDCVEYHPSKWFVGRYGFVLRRPRPLRFQHCAGALGIREAPREVLMKLRAA